MSTTSSDPRNENWTACPTCGNRVLVDPDTGRSEPCAHCASLGKQGPMFAGMLMIGMIVAAAAALLVTCIALLM